jgi:hypothetical protein
VKKNLERKIDHKLVSEFWEKKKIFEKKKKKTKQQEQQEQEQKHTLKGKRLACGCHTEPTVNEFVNLKKMMPWNVSTMVTASRTQEELY